MSIYSDWALRSVIPFANTILKTVETSYLKRVFILIQLVLNSVKPLILCPN